LFNIANERLALSQVYFPTVDNRYPRPTALRGIRNTSTIARIEIDGQFSMVEQPLLKRSDADTYTSEPITGIPLFVDAPKLA
jgi:hypothetical protein